MLNDLLSHSADNIYLLYNKYRKLSNNIKCIFLMFEITEKFRSHIKVADKLSS